MKLINAVCFALLIDDHRAGIETTHPAYIAEKLEKLERCDEASAIRMLDAENKGRFDAWARDYAILPKD
jgi:hypothetical protein